MHKALWKSSVSIVAKSNAELKKIGQKVSFKKNQTTFFQGNQTKKAIKEFHFPV